MLPLLPLVLPLVANWTATSSGCLHDLCLSILFSIGLGPTHRPPTDSCLVLIGHPRHTRVSPGIPQSFAYSSIQLVRHLCVVSYRFVDGVFNFWPVLRYPEKNQGLLSRLSIRGDIVVVITPGWTTGIIPSVSQFAIVRSISSWRLCCHVWHAAIVKLTPFCNTRCVSFHFPQSDDVYFYLPFLQCNLVTCLHS